MACNFSFPHLILLEISEATQFITSECMGVHGYNFLNVWFYGMKNEQVLFQLWQEGCRKLTCCKQMYDENALIKNANLYLIHCIPKTSKEQRISHWNHKQYDGVLLFLFFYCQGAVYHIFEHQPTFMRKCSSTNMHKKKVGRGSHQPQYYYTFSSGCPKTYGKMWRDCSPASFLQPPKLFHSHLK